MSEQIIKITDYIVKCGWPECSFFDKEAQPLIAQRPFKGALVKEWVIRKNTILTRFINDKVKYDQLNIHHCRSSRSL